MGAMTSSGSSGSIAESVRVVVVLADYALADASGKVNVLGAGWHLTGAGPDGLTPQQSLAVFFEVPPPYVGEQFAVAITLLDEADQPVQVPGPEGELQPLRLQQLVQADRPQAAGVQLPPDLPAQTQIVLSLGGGLPLQPGQAYRWVVEVDGNTNPQWQAGFYVVAPPPPPVFGGPGGPADIPGLRRPGRA